MSTLYTCSYVLKELGLLTLQAGCYPLRRGSLETLNEKKMFVKEVVWTYRGTSLEASMEPTTQVRCLSQC